MVMPITIAFSVAHPSLPFAVTMKRNPRDRRATYLITLEDHVTTIPQLQDLAEYLSLMSIADLDVVVVDASPMHIQERNRSVLRWVGRYVPARPQHRGPLGAIDPVRAALDVAACEKVIVADHHVRYGEEALDDMCLLLDRHEVVEPQDYFDPLPWWGGIDAGRMLVHRGIDPLPDCGSTFGFRTSAIRGLRSIDSALPGADPVRRLASQGAEIFSAIELFVRRIPPVFDEWWRERPLQADHDFALPAKTIFFFSLLPVLAILATLGGMRIAGGYVGAIALGSMALALRGRVGAAHVFPWRCCLYAPVWVLERSMSVYWALWCKLTQSAIEATGVAVANRTEESQVVNR